MVNESQLKKYGDQGPFTEEEEKAIQALLELMEADEELKIWKKYAQKGFVIMGLRACKLDAQTCYKTLKELHTHATKTYPDLFGLVDPVQLKPAIEKKIFQVVKRPTDQGPAVIVVRNGNWHISDASIEEVACIASLYIWQVSKMSAEVQKEGFIVIGDMSGFKMKHARQMNIDLVKMAVKLHGSMPSNNSVKGVVAFHSHGLVEDTFNLFKGILPKDIRSMIQITKNDTSCITKLIEPSRLPTEFGGTMPDEEAYMDNIEEEILADQELFNLIKSVQDEVIETYGLKRTERKKKEKKEKKGKKAENVEKTAEVAA